MKVDFSLAASSEQPLPLPPDSRVGQQLQLLEQDGGGWAVGTADGSVLGPVPAHAAAALRSHAGRAPTATLRSLKRSQGDAASVVSVQIRIAFAPAEQPPPLQQAPAPPDDPAGFTLTTSELERLAYSEECRATLRDPRLQEVLLKIDAAPNREQALKQALGNPEFQDFADKMLTIMKPEHGVPR